MSWLTPRDWEGFLNAYNNAPTGLLNKIKWTRVVYRPLDWKARLLAYFGIYVGPQ